MATACGLDQPCDEVEALLAPNVDPEGPVRPKPDYLRRFQLLGYREVTRLSDVMETVVPIHGTGNFPTLQIRPSVFVEVGFIPVPKSN